MNKILYLTSTSQLTSNTNIFTTVVDTEISSEYDMCSLISAQLPVSYYILQDGYNTFSLIEGNQTVAVTIPQGNYSVYSFQASIGELLTSLSPNGYTYTLIYNNIFTQVDTGKYTFQCSNTVTNVGFSFPLNKSISEPFGFIPGTTVFFTSGTLQSVNIISFIPESSVFIHASFCQGASQAGYSDVISCVFSSNSPAYSTINYVNPQIYETAKKTCNLSKIMTFSITDEYSNPIKLHGGTILLQILLFKSALLPQNLLLSQMKDEYKLISDYITMKTNLLDYDYKKRDEVIQNEINDRNESKQFEQSLLKSQSDINSKLDILINLLTKNINIPINKDVKSQNNNGQEGEPNPPSGQEEISY